MARVRYFNHVHLSADFAFFSSAYKAGTPSKLDSHFANKILRWNDSTVVCQDDFAHRSWRFVASQETPEVQNEFSFMDFKVQEVESSHDDLSIFLSWFTSILTICMDKWHGQDHVRLLPRHQIALVAFSRDTPIAKIYCNWKEAKRDNRHYLAYFHDSWLYNFLQYVHITKYNHT